MLKRRTVNRIPFHLSSTRMNAVCTLWAHALISKTGNGQGEGANMKRKYLAHWMLFGMLFFLVACGPAVLPQTVTPTTTQTAIPTTTLEDSSFMTAQMSGSMPAQMLTQTAAMATAF